MDTHETRIIINDDIFVVTTRLREARAILREMVDEEFFTLLDNETCVVCGGEADMAWDYDPEGNRYADHEFCEVHHRDDCFVGKAKRLIEREG